MRDQYIGLIVYSIANDVIGTVQKRIGTQKSGEGIYTVEWIKKSETDVFFSTNDVQWLGGTTYSYNQHVIKNMADRAQRLVKTYD